MTGINVHVQNTMIELKKSALKYEEVGFLEEYYSFYRNYFESKATSAFTIQTAFYALKGMKSQPDMVYLKDTWKSILTIDGSANTLTYQVNGLMGAKSSIKSITKATLLQINNEKVKDITPLAKLESENSLIKIEFKKEEVINLPWTSHMILFQLEGASGSPIFVNKTFEVKTSIVEEIGVTVTQSSSKSSPNKYQVMDGYPLEFSAMNTNENPYLHM